jgi:hypothetical protein
MRLSIKPIWLLVGFSLFLLVPNQSEATPQYSRRYNVKCSACHTIAPVLNEQGFLFKRLGFHLPPALMEGKTADSISDLVKKEPVWSLTNNVAPAVTDFSYSAERTTQVGTSPVSTSAFEVGSWNMYMGGWLPDTNFFYLAEFDIVTAGVTSPALMNAFFGYSGGNAHSSWYVDGGREHLQIGEGTRAAQIYSLLPNSPLLFENPSPTNFIVDQSPVGIDAGYTWVSSSYKRVFAATTKVTNGDNFDGSEILGPSDRNSKDAWTDVDFWYAPESGITFLDYYGKKDNLQPVSQITFHPAIRRQGVFGNYKLLSKVDFLGGWLHSHDGWVAADGSSATFLGNDSYAAIDYYIVQGLAISGRYDLLHQQITGSSGVGVQSNHDWSIGGSKTLTASGNIVGRIAYGYQAGSDPVAAVKSTDKFIQADIAFNF